MSSTPDDKTLKCIRCGFCLDACPTFRLTGNEAASPRGRIYLMRSVDTGVLRMAPDVVSHLDACLGCRACETACPSGVEYGDIVAEFRSKIEDSQVRGGARRMARRLLLSTLTSPGRMRAAMRLSHLAGHLGMDSHALPGPLARILTGDAHARVVLPDTSGSSASGSLPSFSRAVGERRATVAVLPGCVMPVLFGDTNRATVRVLCRNGCDVLAPKNAGCCGALHAHSGYLDEARAKARALVDALEDLKFDALVVNSAGCGSTLKEYGHLLGEDRKYAARAARLAAKVRDVSEFLADLGLVPPDRTFDRTVAYHDACHLAHAQKIASAPRRLLQSVPGLRLVDLPESDTCCGSAGIYNLTQPEMARALLERKVDCIAQTGASVVAAGNPGCIAWIRQGVSERGLDVDVMHPIDILDAAYCNA